jgi:NADH-quinone oxidoreductase subunit M
MIEDYGGLSKSVPVYATFFAIFTLAAIGFPGMNAFIGEFLIISGAFKAKTILGILSIWGIILGVTYMCWLYYRVVLNEVNPKIKHHLFDMDLREVFTLVPLVFLVFFIGVQPHVLLSYMHTSVGHLLEQVRAGAGGQEFDIASNITNFITQYIKEIF